LGPKGEGRMVIIGVCFVSGKANKHNLLHINSTGHDVTQICFNDRIYDIFHTKEKLEELKERYTMKEISVREYITRLEEELDFIF
jgi:hypothetical protein